jgi:hypothetical protein
MEKTANRANFVHGNFTKRIDAENYVGKNSKPTLSGTGQNRAKTGQADRLYQN